MHDLYIGEIYRPGAIFLPLIQWNGSIFVQFCTASSGKKLGGALQPFKIIEISTNRKFICDFLSSGITMCLSSTVSGI